MEVNIHEAKTHLSRLQERIEQGEEITIMRANVPVAKLTAVSHTVAKRELGWARGEFRVPEDFDDALPPEIEAQFYR
jgi:antitoxin (DNA-binding transcriptional repressor) of toxin-antitoxin stability system